MRLFAAKFTPGIIHTCHIANQAMPLGSELRLAG